jgi:serine/threonine protein kinase
MNEYKVGECVGQGLDGQVFRVTHLKSGLIYALKRLTSFSLLQHEVSFLESVSDMPSSAYVPRLECMLPTQNEFIMEWVNGETLNHYVQGLLEDKRTKDEVVPGMKGDAVFRRVAKQMAETLNGLHQVGVCHGDAHLGNWLLDSACNLRLVDFSRAERAPADKRVKVCYYEVSTLGRQLRTLHRLLVGGEEGEELELLLDLTTLPKEERPSIGYLLTMPYFRD